MLHGSMNLFFFRAENERSVEAVLLGMVKISSANMNLFFLEQKMSALLKLCCLVWLRLVQPI